MKKTLLAFLFSLAAFMCLSQSVSAQFATPSTWYWQPPSRPECVVVLSFDASLNYELHAFCPKDNPLTTYYEQIRMGTYVVSGSTLILNIVQTTCASEPSHSMRFLQQAQPDGTLRLIDDWEVAYFSSTSPFDVSSFLHETGCYLPIHRGSLFPTPGWAAGPLH